MNRMNGKRVGMTPRATYLIARGEKDYSAIQRLLKGTEFERLELTYPTLMAYRRGKLVGVLWTRPSESVIIAGPLYVNVKPPVSSFVALRLMEAYEAVLRGHGVAVYLFNIRKTNKAYKSMFDRVGMKPYSEKAGYWWYTRYLDRRQEDGRT